MLKVKCPSCGSYDVALDKGRSLSRARFKCRRCGDTFSFSLVLSSQKEKGKRLNAYDKALIRADHLLGMTYTQLQEEYGITRMTVSKILKNGNEGNLLYVWKHFAYQGRWPRPRPRRLRGRMGKIQVLMQEEIDKGYLRQGYGFPGMDLRGGKKAFVDGWRKYILRLDNQDLENFLSALETVLSVGREEFAEILRRYEEGVDEQTVERLYDALDTLRSAGRTLKLSSDHNGWGLKRTFDQLKVMLVMKPGDYVIIPDLPYREAFTLVEVVSGYDFDPIEVEGYEDFGHFVRVKKRGEFYVSFEDLEDLKGGYRREAQLLYDFLSRDRRRFPLRRPLIDIIDPDMRSIYNYVRRLINRGDA